MRTPVLISVLMSLSLIAHAELGGWFRARHRERYATTGCAKT